MIENQLGLTATYLAGPAGVMLEIPYRITAHGFILTQSSADVALIVLPISAIEDPRFLVWLSQRGIYRIESPDGSVARVGEGRVIDRLRRHRAAPVVIPGRVSAVFGISAEWGYGARRYLECRMAAEWVAAGNGLASRTFNWTILNDDPGLRGDLDRQQAAITTLLELSDRVLDNDADDFKPVLPERGLNGSEPTHRRLIPSAKPEVRIDRVRKVAHLRVFPTGTQLRFDDGRICALASVRRNDVVLASGSQVYRTLGGRAGRNFRKSHQAFLAAANATDEGEIGTTRVAVVADSAAFLIKNVTGGRLHMAARWQLTS